MTVQKLEQFDTQSLPQLKAVLKRVDAMMLEMNSLRETIQTIIQAYRTSSATSSLETVEESLADKLYGSFGQGTPDEMNFDKNLYWERFYDESAIS